MLENVRGAHPLRFFAAFAVLALVFVDATEHVTSTTVDVPHTEPRAAALKPSPSALTSSSPAVQQPTLSDAPPPHSPKVGSPPPDSPPLPKVTPIAEVFVPLQEWKERKLQDIESRVKQRTERGDMLKKDEGDPSARQTRRVGVSGNTNFVSKRHVLILQLLARTCTIPTVANNQSTLRSAMIAYRNADTGAVLNANASLNGTDESHNFSVFKPHTVPTPPVGGTPAERDKMANYTFSDKTSSADADNIAEESATREKEIRLETQKIDPSQRTEDDNVVETTYVEENGGSPVKLSSSKDSEANGEVKASRSLLDLKSLSEKVRKLRNTVSTAVNLTLNPADSTIHENSTCSEISRESAPKPTIEVTPQHEPTATANTGERTSLPRNPAVASGAAEGVDGKESSTGFVVKNKRSFNFASEGAGAQILAYSGNAVGAKNIITENADKYMLVPCASDGVGGSRWVDIELSEYVILKNVQTANYEHYSSAARKFAVLGAEQYPPEKWNMLGVFDFANTRRVQTFRISGAASRKVSRFLRIVYAGKHGHEYYCPVSIFRAFGKNLIADLKEGLETPPNHMEAPRVETAQGGQVEKGANESSDQNEDSVAVNQKQVQVSPTATDTDESDAVSRKGDTAPPASNTPLASKADYNRGEAKAVGAIAPDKRTKGGLSTDDQIVMNVVREEALSPVSGDDNIFRRVTRMIRLLELNQSLTNQYIDTHLARYAAALAATQADAARAAEQAAMSQARGASVAASLERAVDELRASALRRDMLLCALLALIGLLLGTHWVMWTALSGARVAVQLPEQPLRAEDTTSPVSSPEGSAIDHSAPARAIVETVSVDGVHVHLTEVRRRRRRGRERRGSRDIDPQSPASAPYDSPAGARQRALPPLPANSPSRLFHTSNSFQLLSTATDADVSGD